MEGSRTGEMKIVYRESKPKTCQNTQQNARQPSPLLQPHGLQHPTSHQLSCQHPQQLQDTQTQAPELQSTKSKPGSGEGYGGTVFMSDGARAALTPPPLSCPRGCPMLESHFSRNQQPLLTATFCLWTLWGIDPGPS